MGVADFEVVSKHVVERHFQPGDSRGFGLSVADGVEGFLAVERQPPHVVELGIDPSGDDLTLPDGRGGLVDELLVQPGQKGAARAQRFEVRQQRGLPGCRVGHSLHGVQPTADVAQFAGVDATSTRLGGQPLEVPHTPEDGSQFVTKGDFLGQPIDGFVPLGQGVHVGQWCHECSAECPTTHGGARPVQNLHQRGAILVVRVQDFEVAHRESVQPHAVGGPQPGHALDMGRLSVVGQVEVMEHGANRDGGEGRIVQSEALQRSRGKLFGNPLLCVSLGEDPIFQLGPSHVVAKQRPNIGFVPPVDEPLFGFKAFQDAVHPSGVSFCGLKFSRTQVKQRQSDGFGRPMDGGDVVVGLAFQHVVVHHKARGDELRDTALHEALGLFRVFQLVAHGHLQAGFDKLGEVGVQAVVGESGQFDFRGAAVAAFGQHDVQHFGRRHCIRPERFVEIAHTEEQHGVRMLGLDPVVLLHQRGFLACHVEVLSVNVECSMEARQPLCLRRLRCSQGVHTAPDQKSTAGPVVTGRPASCHPVMPSSRLYTLRCPVLFSSWAVRPLRPPPAQYTSTGLSRGMLFMAASKSSSPQ